MNQPLTSVHGTAYPFGMKNCDTDVIISAAWLKTIKRSGLGKAAFASLRDRSATIFDDPCYAGSPILLAGDNFGCGSSREHAAWALTDMGIRVVIAPSFSDIFAGNAFKNGILTVVLREAEVDQLIDAAAIGPLWVDLQEQLVTAPQLPRFKFQIDAFRKECLLAGLSEIDLTLAAEAEISIYEQIVDARRPWQQPALAAPAIRNLS